MSAPIHPDEALTLALRDLPSPSREIVPLAQALGRYLAAELRALVDQPPFDKSAMDGYAYGAAGEDGTRWRLADTIAAGSGSLRALAPGECALVMTGAPIPEGALAVQRREFADEVNGTVRFTKKEQTDNIIRRGENQKAGDRLLSPRRVEPQDIGILASSGYSAVPVAVRPVVGIVSTGDEIVEGGTPLPPAAIYDSNGPQLAAQAAALGCDVRSYGIVGDDAARLTAVIGKALSECDVAIVSGAVSLGDFDFVPRVLESLGVRTVFHGLKMRPGKPTFYGRLGDKSVFGLPGNPVSTFVNFEILLRPHLLARCGIHEPPREVRFPLGAPLSRRGSDRVEYLPARLERTAPEAGSGGGTRVRPLPYHGSSMLSALAEADCLVRMDLGVESIPEGGIVHARLVRP
jgi:molybdopterin molybdotransferase